MAGLPIAIHSGLNDTLFGNYQYPLRQIIEQTAGTEESEAQLYNLFVKMSGQHAIEGFATRTALSAFEPRGELSPHAVDSVQDGFDKAVSYQNWGKKMIISEDMIKFAINKLSFEGKQLTSAFYAGREQLAARYYAEALKGNGSFKLNKFSFDTTTADKRPLFDTGHPSAVKSTNTQSNAFSNAFSRTNLRLIANAMQHFKGDTDNLIGISPDTIVIPNSSNLENEVWEAIASPRSPEDNRNAFNSQYGTWNVIKSKYLDQYITPGTEPYILLDSKQLQKASSAVWLEWEPLHMRSTLDMETNSNIWYADAKYKGAFIDWRYCAAGGIAGATTLS
jgi:hypothetical protein